MKKNKKYGTALTKDNGTVYVVAASSKKEAYKKLKEISAWSGKLSEIYQVN